MRREERNRHIVVVIVILLAFSSWVGATVVNQAATTEEMSDTVLVALITAIPPTFMALVSLLYVRGLHKKINSRMDEFIVIVKQQAREEGAREAREQQ